MSLTKYRNLLSLQVSKLTGISATSILPLLSIPKLKVHGHFSLNLTQLQKLYKLTNPDKDLSTLLITNFNLNSIKNVSIVNNFLNFEINELELTRSVMSDIFRSKEKYGQSEPIENKDVNEDKTILVEFSSPNIAKPFHAGHMRTTLIGSFLKNLLKFIEPASTKVVGINYLGDWGKQYGLLAIGYKRYGDDSKLDLEPLKHLYDVYVKINSDLKEDHNKELEKEAKLHFQLMEQGDQQALDIWTKFRTISLDQYSKIYNRLNVEFDDYSGESSTEPMITTVFQLLEENKLLVKNADDLSLKIDLTSYKLDKPLIRKSDGTTLYLTRDLASIIQRLIKYNFTQTIYVVGDEQSHYFKQLIQIAKLIQPSIDKFVLEKYNVVTKKDWQNNLIHVGFGKVQGMSTRKGTAIFLEDILDTAKAKMLNITNNNLNFINQIDTVNITPITDTNPTDNTTTTTEDTPQAEIVQIADKLATSAIVVQDSSARRLKDYQFSWDRMLDSKGATGIYLQYAYARICGIERNTKLELDFKTDIPTLDFSKLKEPEAQNLIFKLAQFPQALHWAKLQLDPNPLTSYLLELSKDVMVATLKLRVKDLQDKELSLLRWLLFDNSRTVLGNGMRLLGIQPLKKM